MKCIKNDIAIYSMHTNLDMADDGLNDYLAKRDCEWMGGLHRFLGLNVGNSPTFTMKEALVSKNWILFNFQYIFHR